MLRRLSILLSLVVLVLAGCGGDSGDNESETTGGGATTTESTPAETPTEAATEESGGGGEGKDLFASTCGGCHTLADAGTSGTFGPNLDEIKPNKQVVLDTIKAGPGAMPENLLTGADADAVATYVSSVAGS